MTTEEKIKDLKEKKAGADAKYARQPRYDLQLHIATLEQQINRLTKYL